MTTPSTLLTQASTTWTSEQAVDAGRCVGEALLGTASYPSYALQQLDLPDGLENDANFCAELDQIAMCCQSCGWYVEPSELVGDDLCGDCGEDDADA